MISMAMPDLHGNLVQCYLGGDMEREWIPGLFERSPVSLTAVLDPGLSPCALRQVRSYSIASASWRVAVVNLSCRIYGIGPRRLANIQFAMATNLFKLHLFCPECSNLFDSPYKAPQEMN